MTRGGEQTGSLSSLKRALAADAIRHRSEAAPLLFGAPVAIIGVACRLPGGVDSPQGLRRLLWSGADGVAEIPRARWDVDGLYDPDPGASGKIATRWAGCLDSVEDFDAGFFGISPREASRMDPQQRLLLEVSCEALDSAGYPISEVAGTDTGVFVGACQDDYARLQLATPEKIDAHGTTGTTHSVLAGRISYLLDLHGASMAVDTACSSSLVSVHLACQSLRMGESSLALAGGVNLILTPAHTMALSRMGALSPDGRCKPFDIRANGMVRSEGCAMLVLKCLSDAVRDGDRIWAVIRGSAVNQDGRSAGLTAPSVNAQEQVIRRALAHAGVTADELSYIEAHGTGTPLGDPIEVEALGRVLRGSEGPACLLGSVKSNLGHLEAAAGVAGLLKVVLALQAESIPPTLHFRNLNPACALEGTRLRVAASEVPWLRGDAPRRAGVSAFGISGTNAHVIVEEAPWVPPASVPSQARSGPWLLPIAAHHPDSLRELGRRYADWLEQRGDAELANLCHTAAVRRSHGSERYAVVADDRRGLVDALRAYAEQPSRAQERPDKHGPSVATAPRMAFVFSGDGSHWLGMGRELLASEPEFAAAFKACAQQLAVDMGSDLEDELGGEGEWTISVAQALIFAIQVALSRLWQAWGLEPEVVVGHGLGEIAAAHVAGVLSLADACHVVSARSRLLKEVVGQGGMAQAQSGVPESGLDLGASLRHPQAEVGGGDHAHHLARPHELMVQLRDLSPQESTLPLVSSATGSPVDGATLGASHWVRTLQEPAGLEAALDSLVDDGTQLFVEISPDARLSPALTAALQKRSRRGRVVSSLVRGRGERRSMLDAVAALFGEGRAIDFSRIDSLCGSVAELPPYPWNRQHFPVFGLQPTSRRADVQGLVYRVQWRSEPLVASPGSPPGRWLLVGDGGLLDGLGDAIRGAGGACVRAGREPGRDQAGGDAYRLDPGSVSDLARVLAEAFDRRSPCRGVVYQPRGQVEGLFPDVEGCLELAALVRALASTGWRDAARLYVLTRAATDISSDCPMPGQAVLTAVSKVIAHEHPELRCTCVDLAPRLDPGVAIERLLAELTAGGAEDEVALAPTGRHVPRLLKGVADASAATRLSARDDGCYVITGGLGGLGAAAAQLLIDRGAKHLVLLGRSAASRPEARSVLEALEARGARVEAEAVDVADKRALQRVLARHGALRGVIHAAGVLADGTLPRLDRAAFERVLAPKALGALHLHELTLGDDLDFFVMFSSAASILGSPGQANYTAANAYLDALAHFRRSQGLPAQVINWGPWDEVGMAAAQANRGARIAQRGLRGLTLEEGTAALEYAMLSGEPQLGVMALHLRQWVQSNPSRSSWRLLSELSSEAGELGAASRDFRRSLEGAPAGADRLKLLLPNLQAIFAPVLGLEATAIDPAVPLEQLGLDSLMAVELRNRLESGLGVRLSAATLFTYSSLDALAPFLLSKLGLDTAGDALDSEDEALLAEIARLPPEEVERLLLEETDALSDQTEATENTK